MKSIKSIAERINDLCPSYRMGKFQETRQKLRGLSHPKSYRIFTSQTIFPTYAYHSGGRNELQFNIGFEGHERDWLRFGVAFSLEPSRSLPDPLVLKPKILKLNHFLSKNQVEFQDIRFWYHSDLGKSHVFPAQPVAEDLIKLNTFLFWGKLSRREEVDPGEVLFLFDRLLALYEYVEGGKHLPTVSANLAKGFQFKSGSSPKADSTTKSSAGGTRTVHLHHNKLQKVLFEVLAKQFGQDNVGEENDTGRGSRVDLVVRNASKYTYYEIKTGPDIRSCIREALSQLLEYSFWPGGNPCEQMIIVSENPVTHDARQYLHILRTSFHLPVFYQHLDVSTKALSNPE